MPSSLPTVRLIVASTLAALATGCATQQSVTPNFTISREIPADAALAWLKKVAAPAQIGSRADACRVSAQGIRSRDGKSVIAWKDLHSSPWSVGFSHTVGSYAVYATDSRDSVAGWVTVSRKEVKDSAGFIFSDHGDECGAFFVHHKTANEKQINETTRQVERTLSALAALGAIIEKQSAAR